MHKNFAARSLLLTILCLLAGCTSARYSLPVNQSAKSLAPDELASIRELLLARWHEIRKVRVLMRGQVVVNQDRQGLKVALVWSSPDRLRFETFPSVGAYTLTLLVAAGAEGQFLDFRSRRALVGKDERTIGEILGVEVQREELVGALLGRVSESALKRSDLNAYLEPNGSNIILLWDSNRRWARVDRRSGLVTELSYGDDVEGALVLAVSNSGLFSDGGVSFPGEVRLRAPQSDFFLTLSMASANFPETLSDALFEVELPTDFDIY